MTIVSLVKSTRRGNSSRKQRPLWLPIIAPKDDAPPSVNSGLLDSPGPVRASIPRSRVRFPPRSRTGCWTCRSRKVKCDESHPQCNQCTRLGHTCDYRPRLCFRDDTRRVTERMTDVKITGNIVWDPNASTSTKRPLANSAACDLLPSFLMLTSDDDREKKAEASVPGTYHVIVIPESFSHLPEYNENDSEMELGSLVSSHLFANNENDQDISILQVDDPNVVILRTFRDIRRPPCFNRKSPPHSQEPDSRDSSSAMSNYSTVQDIANEDHIQERFELGNYETSLLGHFRNVALLQLLPGSIMFGSPEGRYMLSAEVFDQEAAKFPPLLHAMMAISALCLARQGSDHNMDSLQYYHQAFHSLQTNPHGHEDFSSDGIFLTHFLLLVYEVTAAKPNNSELQSYHISRLLHVTLGRQSTYGGERYPLVVRWICHIDLYSLFSGTGTGEFVRAVVEGRLYPGAESLLYPIIPENSSLVYPGEHDHLLTIGRLYHDTLMIAFRLGLFAAEMRKFKAMYPPSHLEEQHGPEELREELRRLWHSPEIRFLTENGHLLQKRIQEMLQQTSVLFHTALLFSYSSVWSGQRVGLGAACEEEIHHHAAILLQATETMIPKAQESDRHFIVFPIFLAGAVVASNGLKIRAWELLSSLEEEEMGYHASTTCYMLQLVYERQMQHSRGGSQPLWIDWVELLAERGVQLVHCG